MSPEAAAILDALGGMRKPSTPAERLARACAEMTPRDWRGVASNRESACSYRKNPYNGRVAGCHLLASLVSDCQTRSERKHARNMAKAAR